jgi:HPt (histidine-containing phosphotransfer) domain-containing protein
MVKTGVGKSFLCELLMEFGERHGQAAQEILQLLDQGDLDGAGRYAHTLKGLAGTFSAPGLRRSSAALEQALQEQSLGSLAGLVEELEQEIAAVLSSLRALAAVAPEASPPSLPAEGSIADLQPALHRLYRLLQANDMDAEDCYQALAVDLNRLVPEPSHELGRAIKALEFEKAGSLVLALCPAQEIPLFGVAHD